MKKTFRILVISDTHTMHKRSEKLFPKGDFDMIIHAGDISSRGYKEEIKDFMQWFGGLWKFKYKLMIAGNHDFLFEDNPDEARELIPDGVIYLENEAIEIEGIKFWGSPINPWFHNWAFNRKRGDDIKRYWDMIPNDSDVVITHSPAANCLDFTNNNYEHVGCSDLAFKLEEIEPIAHISGHIHEAYGKMYKHGTMFYNASTLNEYYMPKNTPHIIEVKFDEDDKPYINIEDV